MSEIIKEIEEDIRRERFDKLWYSIGRIMVWVSAAVVMITIVIVLWQNHKQSYAEAQTSEFIRGTDRLGVEDYKGAIAIFSSLAADENSPYYGLAMLRKAEAQLLLGNHSDAESTYRILAKKYDIFGDLAKLLASNDTPITEPAPGSPLYYSQSEWRGWQLLQQGKTDDAVKIFLTLRDDETAPRSLRERVAEALWHIAPEKMQ